MGLFQAQGNSEQGRQNPHLTELTIQQHDFLSNMWWVAFGNFYVPDSFGRNAYLSWGLGSLFVELESLD